MTPTRASRRCERTREFENVSALNLEASLRLPSPSLNCATAPQNRHPGRETSLIDSVLSELPIWNLDHHAARHFGSIKALLERRGERLADADLFIAAICLTHGATLVTHNTRHFNRIPGLVIEDWLA